MKFSKEIKVGLLAVVSLLMLYFGFNFLKGSDFFSSTKKYTAIYDNVDGLTASNPVRINGLVVGQVKSVEILQDQGNKLLVTVELKKDIRITQGTRAVLADDGLLGGKLIRLVINPARPLLDDGGRLIATRESGLSALIRERTLPVLNNVDSLTYQLNKIVGQFDQTGVILNKTLASANGAVGTLDLTIAENRAGLRTALANVNQLARSFNETEQKLNPILDKADSFADSLQKLELRQTLNTVNKTIDNMQKLLGSIEQGRGSLGKLTTDEALYKNVNATTANMALLLSDLRQNPKRYVHFSLFGKKDKDKPPVAQPGSMTITTSTVTTTNIDSTGNK
ncbi:MlaD family protein [Spirosoma rhododendri]|uniref:MCE family protein n=1 Tax=Spirosoma rhododendri TaxID=2728024 RepID=A0A7L5DI47_9BACT|nr:MlaD family protein [Spirosoma rhododendri]QJD78054.1 MCE family protein [Spirosoma rhododendri]